MRLSALSDGNSIEIVPFTEESPYYDEALNLIRTHIHLGREVKSPAYVAIHNGKIIGTLLANWMQLWMDQSYALEEELEDTTEDFEQPYFYSFDVATLPEYRGQKVGQKLIDTAIQQYEQDKSEYGPEAHMRILAINPAVTNLLTTKYGFSLKKSHEGEDLLFKS